MLKLRASRTASALLVTSALALSFSACGAIRDELTTEDPDSAQLIRSYNLDSEATSREFTTPTSVFPQLKYFPTPCERIKPLVPKIEEAIDTLFEEPELVKTRDASHCLMRSTGQASKRFYFTYWRAEVPKEALKEIPETTPTSEGIRTNFSTVVGTSSPTATTTATSAPLVAEVPDSSVYFANIVDALTSDECRTAASDESLRTIIENSLNIKDAVLCHRTANPYSPSAELIALTPNAVLRFSLREGLEQSHLLDTTSSSTPSPQDITSSSTLSPQDTASTTPLTGNGTSTSRFTTAPSASPPRLPTPTLVVNDGLRELLKILA